MTPVLIEGPAKKGVPLSYTGILMNWLKKLHIFLLNAERWGAICEI